MTVPQIFLTVIVILAFALIITETLRVDLVAILVLLALAATRLVEPQEAISGFSRSSVITLLGLFIITEALDRTGVTRIMVDQLMRIGGNTEARLVLLMTVSGAVLSLFMNNIAAGAVLLPTAINIARRRNISPSKLLMPLSFGTLLGGMATYFTTANILVSTALHEQNLQSLNILDFTPTGGVVALAGIAFMVIIGRRMLPVRSPAGQYASRHSAPDLEKSYQLSERMWEATVCPNSPLLDLTLAESAIGQRLGVTVIAIWHGKIANLTPAPEDIIHEGYILLLTGREDRVTMLKEEGLQIGRSGKNGLHGPRVSLAEAVIAPRSQIEGKSLKDLNFRKKFGLTAVALWREGRSYRTDVGTFPLRFSDALLMVGEPSNIKLLQNEPDFLVLDDTDTETPNPERAPVSIAITALVLFLAAANLVPVAEAMLFGAVLMVLTGCLSMDDSYRAIEWRVIFLIAGMIPVSIAMTKTGLAAKLAETMVNVFGSLGPIALIGGLYVLTVLLTQVMSGQVTALVLAPIAISAALQMNTNPQADCVAVAIGCSTCFLTPISHPVNVLMMGPAGYNFRDFLRIGFFMTLVCLIVLLIALPLFWKL